MSAFLPAFLAAVALLSQHTSVQINAPDYPDGTKIDIFDPPDPSASVVPAQQARLLFMDAAGLPLQGNDTLELELAGDLGRTYTYTRERAYASVTLRCRVSKDTANPGCTVDRLLVYRWRNATAEELDDAFAPFLEHVLGPQWRHLDVSKHADMEEERHDGCREPISFLFRLSYYIEHGPYACSLNDQFNMANEKCHAWYQCDLDYRGLEK